MKSVWKNTIVWIGATLAAIALAIATPHESGVMGHMPQLNATRLDQQNPVTIPEDLGADRTLALIAFKKSQRSEIESWINGLQLRSDPSISWVRVSVFNDPGDPAGRSAAEQKLASRYPTAQDRMNLLSVFTDRAAFMRSAGLNDEEHAYAVVVNRRGEVLAKVEGEFDADKASALRETLNVQGL